MEASAQAPADNGAKIPIDCDFEQLVNEVIDLLCKHANDQGFDQDSRILIAKLIKYLIYIKQEKTTAHYMDYLRSLKHVLKPSKPNVLVVQELIQQIRLEYWRSRRRKSGSKRSRWAWFVDNFGASAALAMGAGAGPASLLFLICFALYLYWIGRASKGQTNLLFMDIDILAPLLLAALLGAIVSLLSRVQSFYAMTVYHPALVFANGLLKPAIGMAMAVAVFAILESHVVTVNALNLQFAATDNTSYYSVWVIGFLSGFSERFAGDLVARAEGVFGKSK